MSHLFVMALGPDGSPLGPVTALGVLPLAVLHSVAILVAPDGRRALFVITGSQDQLTRRVLAMPLVCTS